MNHSETAKLLALCAAFDARTIGDADVIAWQQMLAEVPAVQASAAVMAHYRRTNDRIGPSDVLAGVHVMRSERARKVDALPPPPNVDPDDVPAYLAAIRERTQRYIDGEEFTADRDAAPTKARPAELASTFRGMPRRDRTPVAIEAAPEETKPTFIYPSQASLDYAREELAKAARAAAQTAPPTTEDTAANG
jgi:hypothetical protein